MRINVTFAKERTRGWIDFGDDVCIKLEKADFCNLYDKLCEIFGAFEAETPQPPYTGGKLMQFNF